MPENSDAPREADIRPADLTVLARQHGLRLQPTSFVYNETGLDFQVIQALDENQQPWILRLPRRPDVLPRAGNEYRVLQLLKDQLPVAVPAWHIYTPALIAYPRLAGTPVADIDMAQKQYIWHLDPLNLPPTFITSLAKALVALHGVTAEMKCIGVFGIGGLPCRQHTRRAFWVAQRKPCPPGTGRTGFLGNRESLDTQQPNARGNQYASLS